MRLVGDSIVRGQLSEFCGRNITTRKRFCIPGARLEDIEAAAEVVTDQANTDTLYLVHAGTNDVQSARAEDILAKYRRVIRRYRQTSRNVIVSGILPRTKAFPGFHRKACDVNEELRRLCENEGVVFTSQWEHFYDQPHLYRRDGLHLNDEGSARLGRLLNAVVVSFSKNCQRGRGAGSP